MGSLIAVLVVSNPIGITSNTTGVGSVIPTIVANLVNLGIQPVTREKIGGGSDGDL